MGDRRIVELGNHSVRDKSLAVWWSSVSGYGEEERVDLCGKLIRFILNCFSIDKGWGVGRC